MSKSGTGPDKRICYSGYKKERPVFDLSAVKPENERVIVFYVSGSYLHFRNIEVVGTQVTIVGHTQSECFRNEGGSDNIYEHLSMHDGMAIGFYIVTGKNNLVLNCDAYNNYDPVSDGRITDSQGRTVDFKNTVIVMTSNIGAKALTAAGAKLGFDADDKKAEADADAAYAQAKETVLAELRQTFRPEFLNRIDDIIVFRALTEQDIEEVTRRMLKTVAGRMETMDIHLDASDEAVKELAKEGFDPKYGARPLRRAIQSKVEDAVAEKMLDGTLKTGDTAKLAVEDDKLVVTK